MHSVRLNLKRLTGKRSAIVMIVRCAGSKKVFGTGISVEVERWNQKREEVRDDWSINAKLESARSRMLALLKEKGRIPTKEEVSGSRDRKTVIQAIEEAKRRSEANGSVMNSVRAYNTCKSLVQRWGKDTYTSEVRAEWVTEFVRWMHLQNYANGHTAKMLRIIRAALRDYVPERVWKESARPKATPAETVYLTKEEVKAIEEFDAEGPLEKAKDLFLLGIYTGQRQSDWRKADWTRIKTIGSTKVLVLTQQKTGQVAALPVSPKLTDLLHKYSRGWPSLSIQKLNQKIKELCKKAGINQTVTLTEHRGGKSIEVSGQKWEFVSSHTARRTFATNAILAGIPASEVMKFTGHRTLSAFMQYIRTTAQEAAILYAEHPFFK